MGRFINGEHHSWTSSLAPNERLGEADDMEFYRRATAIEEEKKIEEGFKEALDDLATKLKAYDCARDTVIEAIVTILREYPQKQITSERISELCGNSIAVHKILEYYVNKYS